MNIHIYYCVLVFRVVTVFVRLVSLSNHKNMRQRFKMHMLF